MSIYIPNEKSIKKGIKMAENKIIVWTKWQKGVKDYFPIIFEMKKRE
jgi:hypothetical protein